ncbi:cobyrinic acid a,c-diamide synthase [Leptolyngbyaceae cyanobacterium CCMR0082]|uniref:Cobyrinic acid a,c-diamide synthase n=1 Tax=Adonisia turfae CCMR0082 TaxID=2304604 RepID=A0A6M0SMJ0_9CYAN|nr:cobyrinic acid a,c-diamide synthase [Adonisia turfae CCMR0082]
MIICFSSLKGGCGKTSLSIHLAHEIAKSGSRVLLIDADPQGSASDWNASREDKPLFSVIGMAQPTIHRDLPDLARDYDHVVIDSPPRVAKIARSGIIASNLVLIPVTPSSYDVWAADETVEIIGEAQITRPDIKGAFVINRKIVNTSIGREVASALKEYELPLLKTAINQRVVISEASNGSTAQELEPTGKAANEIRLLTLDILRLMEVDQW